MAPVVKRQHSGQRPGDRAMKRLFAVLMFMAVASLAHAQAGNTLTTTGSGAPTGTCAFLQFYVTVARALYDCAGSSWNAVSGGGGGGTVTSVSVTTANGV